MNLNNLDRLIVMFEGKEKRLSFFYVGFDWIPVIFEIDEDFKEK